MEKKMNVPGLRFPEFEGEWELKKLGEIATIKSDKYNPDKEKISYKCVELEHLATETGQLLGYIDSINSGSIKNKFEKNDVLYGKLRPYLKKYLQAPFEGVCSSEIWVLKGLEVTNDFLYRIIQTENFTKLANQATGSKMPRADWNVLSVSNFSYPSFPEQTKIASFLTAADNKLTQLKKKKSLLDEYKKGVMQQIFSQELRFKDDNGEDFPEWEEKKIGKICKIYDGTHQTPDYVEDGIPFYSVEHVTANNFTKTKYISKDVFERENAKVKLEKGDILMTKIGDIGTAKYIDWDVEASFYVSLALLKKTKINNNEFIYHYISSSFFKNELYQRTIHVAFPKKINLGEIGECLIKLPSLPEQTQIANFLSAIDERINHCSKQIERMEEWKKGLLQQMFC